MPPLSLYILEKVCWGEVEGEWGEQYAFGFLKDSNLSYRSKQPLKALQDSGEWNRLPLPWKLDPPAHEPFQQMHKCL